MPNIPKRLLINDRRKEESQSEKIPDEESTSRNGVTAGFKDGGKGHEPRKGGGLLMLKKAGKQKQKQKARASRRNTVTCTS